MLINNRMPARRKPSFLEEPISRVGLIKLHHVRPAHLSPKSLPNCELLICTFLRRKPGHLMSNDCTNLINNEQLLPVIDSKQAPHQCGNLLANNRKTRNLLNFLEHASTWHSLCSFPGTSQEIKESSMRMLIATMFKKIPVRKTQQRASICKRCGVRVYSLSFLKAHLEAHDRKPMRS